jgi:broad specificity phosphatase PhoE
MQTLWLFRSCSTAWDEAERLRGSTDLPATDSSVASTRELVARMAEGPEVLFHPADEAAAETAQVVAARFACRVCVLPDLADPDLGLLEGLALTDFEKRFESRFAEWMASPLTVEPPEGEPLAQARARILDAIADVLAHHPRQRVGLVVHPIALAMVRDALARGDGSRLWERIQGRAPWSNYALPAGAAQLLGD